MTLYVRSTVANGTSIISHEKNCSLESSYEPKKKCNDIFVTIYLLGILIVPLSLAGGERRSKFEQWRNIRPSHLANIIDNRY